MPEQTQPDPSIVFNLVNAFQQTAALRAAVKLDLFTALSEGSSTAAELARRCSASPRGIRILCDYLTIMGLLQKEGETYENTPTSASFLSRNSPSCVASIVHFMSEPGLKEPFDHLDEIVRKGSTSLPGQGTVEPNNPIWVEFAHNMAPMMAPLTGPLGNAVLEGNREPMRVLDIAAGHGLFGIEVARQNPQAEITALDWEAVLQVARANAEKAGVLDRYHLKVGSAFEVDFEGPYDVILLTNFLHHYDIPTCKELLEKCHAALAAGGTVAALEFVPNPDRVTPPPTAAFALIMLATTASGDAYTFDEYREMLESTGFTSVDMQDIPNSPHRIVRGRKKA